MTVALHPADEKAKEKSMPKRFAHPIAPDAHRVPLQNIPFPCSGASMTIALHPADEKANTNPAEPPILSQSKIQNQQSSVINLSPSIT
jgi:hypothetical protein